MRWRRIMPSTTSQPAPIATAATSPGRRNQAGSLTPRRPAGESDPFGRHRSPGGFASGDTRPGKVAVFGAWSSAPSSGSSRRRGSATSQPCLPSSSVGRGTWPGLRRLGSSGAVRRRRRRWCRSPCRHAARRRMDRCELAERDLARTDRQPRRPESPVRRAHVRRRPERARDARGRAHPRFVRREGHVLHRGQGARRAARHLTGAPRRRPAAGKPFVPPRRVALARPPVSRARTHAGGVPPPARACVPRSTAHRTASTPRSCRTNSPGST